MPQLKLGNKDVAPEATGFGIYEGPEPRPGVYSGTIKNMRMKESKNGNLYFNMLIEFEDNEGEKEVFNGYPIWNMIVPGDSDIQQTRVAQLINAVTGKREANVDYNALDAAENAGVVNKIGGKSPIGTKVKVTVSRENDAQAPDGWRLRITDIFPRSGSKAAPVEVEEETEYVEPVGEEDGVDPDAVDLDELREELDGEGLVALKRRAKELEISADALKGLKKPEVIELILAQYADADEEAEDAESDEESLDETTDALREELAELDLIQLKKRAKTEGFTVKDLKGLDADAIVELIVDKFAGGEAEAEEDEVAENDDEGRWLYAAALAKSREELVALLVEAGYDEDDFEDEDEYDQASLVDTLVEEDVVAASDGTPF